MIDIFRIFKPLPKPGDKFVFDDGMGKDPFGRNKQIAEVIETRSGWVRYKILNTTLADESLPRSHFHFCYKPAPNSIPRFNNLTRLLFIAGEISIYRNGFCPQCGLVSVNEEDRCILCGAIAQGEALLKLANDILELKTEVSDHAS